MPHQGKNKGRDGGNWNFDYTKNTDERLAKFVAKVEAIGDHPAILMWGLGNEVHLDREYLEYVNLMSEAIHEPLPLALTSLTMINAKPENIEKIKRFAPDLDVVGVQSYSVGAVRGGIRNMEEHWGKPYYYSEFNGKGPWNFSKTEWGTAYDDMPADRVAEIDACYDAIEAAPRCLGSTAFVWGQFGMQRPSYFSLLLSPHPSGVQQAEKMEAVPGQPGYPLITPHAEVLGRRFTGSHPIANHAPLITALETTDGARGGRRAGRGTASPRRRHGRRQRPAAVHALGAQQEGGRLQGGGRAVRGPERQYRPTEDRRRNSGVPQAGRRLGPRARLRLRRRGRRGVHDDPGEDRALSPSRLHPASRVRVPSGTKPGHSQRTGEGPTVSSVRRTRLPPMDSSFKVRPYRVRPLGLATGGVL